MIGSDARVPGMVLLRAPLGRRGSYVPTVLNVAQNLGWSTFELIIISIAAAKLSDSVFGFSARWVWAVAFGAVSVALGLLGPIGFVRRYVKKFAAWAVLASIVYLTWWVLDKSHVHAFWAAKGSGGMTFGQGVDLVIGSIVSWTRLAADYTRFARSRRSAFWGTGLGYFVPTLWCFGIGCLLVLARDISAPEQIPAAVAAGSAGILALLALTVDESDEAFADIHSTAAALQNLLPRVSQRLLIVRVGAAATTGAVVINLRHYQDFLLLLGSVFVPLFGVLLADWLSRGAHYDEADVFDGPAVRVELLAVWIAGFCLYQWLAPVGPHWWTSLVGHTSPGHALERRGDARVLVPLRRRPATDGGRHRRRSVAAGRAGRRTRRRRRRARRTAPARRPPARRARAGGAPAAPLAGWAGAHQAAARGPARARRRLRPRSPGARLGAEARRGGGARPRG